MTTANIRMYKVGELGDCFLITFEDETDKSHVMIDCGSFRNSNKSKTRLNKIVKHIKKELDGQKIDLLVGTHQHNDHMSGFTHAKDVFKTIDIRQVFLSWLDDPSDTLSEEVQESHRSIVKALKSITNLDVRRPIDKSLKEALSSLIDFSAVGDGSSVTDKATELLRTIGEESIKYVSPGMSIDLPGPLASKVKVHVLGPPRSYAFLKDTTPKKKETYDPHLAQLSFQAQALSRVTDTTQADYPFRSSFKIPVQDLKKKKDNEGWKKYYQKSQAWRKIDNDWKAMAENMALHLDSLTNNTSIVLAFELIDSGKFLLFVGDAQTGNWNSWSKIEWKEDIDLKTILSNTVFYKVGHHASHNATHPAFFEQVDHPDLVAMIPVDKSDPNLTKSYHPWRMPAKNLLKRLVKKTKGRVLRMDDTQVNRRVPWKNQPKIEKELYVEIQI